LLITHDLGVVAETAQRVAVMYAGHIVEEAGVEELFAHPYHPYTRGLKESIPRIGRAAQSSQGLQRLHEIEGMVPSLRDEIIGCAFAPRCAFSTERCHIETPSLIQVSRDHAVACWECDGGVS
ncbi:MAG: ABC transporter ATP-binding protein, partial [Deltaproteobacteria bacterium]|nr:ABC transporter ATP-binding protein [Deltaproteobacteria bacterium]